MLTVYGIPNCDTMKKAFHWLKGQGIAYAFHDYKTQGIDPETLKAWTRLTGWEVVLNKASTTFKALPDAAKTGLDERKAIALMTAQPSMIKRPVFESGGHIHIGFKAGRDDDAIRRLAG